jgi:hypothetical protein
MLHTPHTFEYKVATTTRMHKIDTHVNSNVKTQRLCNHRMGFAMLVVALGASIEK